MKIGVGAKLEASFRPKVHWGAEFLADRVRICGLKAEGGKAAAAATFEGSFPEAEAFARSHGLAYAGLHAAVSHLPFKLEALEPLAAGAEDDTLAQADRLKPTGLALDSLDVQGFAWGGERGLVMAREDAVRGFADHLPDPLAALWALVPSPLALLPHARLEDAPGRLAVLLVEEHHTHVVFLRGGAAEAYAKAFTGLEEARKDPSAFAREMKKALIYHYGSRFPGSSLETVAIWRDGTEGEAASALARLGLPLSDPIWSPALAGIAPIYRVAAAMALAGFDGPGSPAPYGPSAPLASFAVPRPEAAQTRRIWMRRAGQLARSGFHVASAAMAAALLLAVSAAVFRIVVEAKAKTWSGELRKWDEFQKGRLTVERQLAGLQGLLSRRTEGYASLQRIAAVLPAEVWLEEWEAEARVGSRYVHRLSGYSLAEDRVPQFLAALEDGKRFQSVKLKSTERIKGEKIEKETGIAANRKDLFRFQMVLSE